MIQSLLNFLFKHKQPAPGSQISFQTSILESVTEMLFITDVNLKILSVNEVAERKLHTSSEDLINKDLFQIINLRSLNNKPLDIQSLSIDRAISENSTRIISNLYLYLPDTPLPSKVSMHIKPVLNSKNMLQNISFIIVPNYSGEIPSHKILKEANNRLNELTSLLKKALTNTPSDVRIDAALTGKIQKDLVLTGEIEDHPLKVTRTIVNIADISKDMVGENQSLARLLNVDLEFGTQLSYDQKNSESTFTTTMDGNLLKILIEKLILLAIFLVAAENEAKITLSILKSDNFIEIVIKFPFYFTDSHQKEDLFVPYYGNLSSLGKLKSGSGLEGFIAKSLSIHLNIQLKIIPYPQEKQSAFVLYIPIYFGIS